MAPPTRTSETSTDLARKQFVGGDIWGGLPCTWSYFLTSWGFCGSKPHHWGRVWNRKNAHGNVYQITHTSGVCKTELLWKKKVSRGRRWSTLLTLSRFVTNLGTSSSTPRFGTKIFWWFLGFDMRFWTLCGGSIELRLYCIELLRLTTIQI